MICLCRNLCTFESTITTEMLIRPKNPGVSSTGITGESEVISDDIPDVSDYILVVVKRFSVSRAAG